MRKNMTPINDITGKMIGVRIRVGDGDRVVYAERLFRSNEIKVSGVSRWGQAICDHIPIDVRYMFNPAEAILLESTDIVGAIDRADELFEYECGVFTMFVQYYKDHFRFYFFEGGRLLIEREIKHKIGQSSDLNKAINILYGWSEWCNKLRY